MSVLTTLIVLQRFLNVVPYFLDRGRYEIDNSTPVLPSLVTFFCYEHQGNKYVHFAPYIQ